MQDWVEDQPDVRTSPTLLGLFHKNPHDPVAWSRFVTLYGPKIYAWCRAWKLQEADAEDVTQAVLMKLVFVLREFEYDPRKSFRAWLKTVTHHVWRDFAKHQARFENRTDRAALLEQAQARESLADALSDAFDEELLETAMTRVRLRVEPQTWEAFRLLAFVGCTGRETADRLGMTVAGVFLSRSRVQRMLRDELGRLENPVPASAG
ncbi:RNA polymerase sigma factor [Zavarzinella formosa]|uniref:RNA polymerase sigma factor n=1 Tax=Zavarzinella formosa TaxID=360055 RepID=UPI0002F4C293|nr:sigma-70 family RNA polymerase sigma factor [Zavarzinella formosa]